MALGAKRADVLRLMLVECMKPVCAGVAIGLAMAFAVTRLMVTLLYQVQASDPHTFAMVTVALMGPRQQPRTCSRIVRRRSIR